ncbi:hypothetical protein [Parasitella parasitica]|uniref:Uncharacterized protein n=1 Tax=Parasitella parasitica TaxID=35722 RepID=A0A0B7NPR0_9FUNG|nr:hypothetical protein [Parasitella parasitica]
MIQLANEFFQYEPTDESNVATLHKNSFRHSKENWAREFIIDSSRLTAASSMPSSNEDFELIYPRHSSKSPTSQLNWTNQLSNRQKPSPPFSEEEQVAFQRAFEQVNDGSEVRDWDKEFADNEIWEANKNRQSSPYLQQPMRPKRAIPRSSSQLLDVKDWSEEFSKYHDLTAQGTNSISKSLENEDDWIQRYQSSIDSKQSELKFEEEISKEWDRLNPDGKPYGYRAIHPEYGQYSYMAENPYLHCQDAIDNAIHSSLADAIMALEAKTQLDRGDAKTWEQLGLKQQENERDAAAITALEMAVKIDANCLDAWLALAVSYTNEHCRMDTYNCLEQWIANSPKYKHILQGKLGQNYTDQTKRHNYIAQLFLEAARVAPGEEMDADVQVGLGVLFNMSEEYDKAVDCFRAALISRPQDYQLWNKVGATLANSRDNMGAMDMYFNALQINPSFVRARYNLGISYMNMGQHQEAAEHLLTALDFQRGATRSAGAAAGAFESGVSIDLPNGTSDGIWDSLRLIMYMMNREDLAAQCDYHSQNSSILDFFSQTREEHTIKLKKTNTYDRDLQSFDSFTSSFDRSQRSTITTDEVEKLSVNTQESTFDLALGTQNSHAWSEVISEVGDSDLAAPFFFDLDDSINRNATQTDSIVSNFSDSSQLIFPVEDLVFNEDSQNQKFNMEDSVNSLVSNLVSPILETFDNNMLRFNDDDAVDSVASCFSTQEPLPPPSSPSMRDISFTDKTPAEKNNDSNLPLVSEFKFVIPTSTSKAHPIITEVSNSVAKRMKKNGLTDIALQTILKETELHEKWECGINAELAKKGSLAKVCKEIDREAILFWINDSWLEGNLIFAWCTLMDEEEIKRWISMKQNKEIEEETEEEVLTDRFLDLIEYSEQSDANINSIIKNHPDEALLNINGVSKHEFLFAFSLAYIKSRKYAKKFIEQERVVAVWPDSWSELQLVLPRIGHCIANVTSKFKADSIY